MALPARTIISEQDDDRSPTQPQNLQGSVITMPAEQQQTEDPGFDIIETDDNGQPLGQPQQQQQAQPEQPQEPEQGDEGQGEEQPRERVWERGAQKGGRYARQRAARDRNYAELTSLRAQVAELENRLTADAQQRDQRFDQIDRSRVEAQVADVDRQIAEAQSRAASARQRMSEAMVSQDANAFADALEQRDQAIMNGQQLLVRKNVLTSGNPLGIEGRRPAQGQPQPEPQRPQQPQAPRLSRAAQQMADDFAADHDWIDLRRDPNGRIIDPDSRIVGNLDNDVMAEGFVPDTQDYWNELEDRMRQYLPHRFAPQRGNGRGNGAQQSRQPQQPRQQQPQTPPQLRGPQVGGAPDRAPANGRTQVYITPDRKQAMIEAGILAADGRTVINQQKMKNVLKGYAEYDAAYGGTRQ